MPYPLSRPHYTQRPRDEAGKDHLRTFDPAIFYPALSAHENVQFYHTAPSALAQSPDFGSKSLVEPKIPKDFDPAVFYPALAAREKEAAARPKPVWTPYTNVWARHAEEEDGYPAAAYISPHSVDLSTLSSQPRLIDVKDSRVKQISRRRRQRSNHTRRRLWIAGVLSLLLVILIVIVLAWLGTHHWLESQPVYVP